jgi:Uma2 family endonuclease
MAQRAILTPAGDQTPPRMTYQEFLRWIPDGVQAEWVDGEVVLVTTSARHVRIVRLLTMVMQTFVEVFDLGEVFPAPFQMKLPSRPSGREPDLLVVRTEHLDRVKRLWIEGPADLVIEVLSEESVTIDRVEKRREYEAAGVPEYLIVDGRDGRQGVEFLRLNAVGRFAPVKPDTSGRYASQVVPGFWFTADWFAPDSLPSARGVLALLIPKAD